MWTELHVTQSTPIPESSYGFAEGSHLQLNGQRHSRSVAEDSISNKLK